jgi:hypothetical protein
MRVSGFIRRSLGAGWVGTGLFRVQSFEFRVSSAEALAQAGLERVCFGFRVPRSLVPRHNERRGSEFRVAIAFAEIRAIR